MCCRKGSGIIKCISERNILSVLSNVSVINGLYFEQLWYVDHHNVLYNKCKAIKVVSSS